MPGLHGQKHYRVRQSKTCPDPVQSEDPGGPLLPDGVFSDGSYKVLLLLDNKGCRTGHARGPVNRASRSCVGLMRYTCSRHQGTNANRSNRKREGELQAPGPVVVGYLLHHDLLTNPQVLFFKVSIRSRLTT